MNQYKRVQNFIKSMHEQLKNLSEKSTDEKNGNRKQRYRRNQRFQRRIKT